jgi:unsaturated rhamnogalacturonyl hydrolase
MARYIDENESIYSKCGDSVDGLLSTVAGRYVGSNPPHPMAFRAYCADGILKKHDYSYDFNMVSRFPELKNGQYVYAWAKYWSDQPVTLTFILHCYGPLILYANEVQVYKANIVDELNADRRISVEIPLRKGWNYLCLQFTKTEAGCGGSFGPGSYKSNPVHVLAPSPERSGHEGWIYSEPQDQVWMEIPFEETPEADTGMTWYPRLDWNEEEQQLAPVCRIFGNGETRTVLAWTKIKCSWQGQQAFELNGSGTGELTVLVDGKVMTRQKTTGDLRIPLSLNYGQHDLVVLCRSSEKEWGFKLGPLPFGVVLENPYPVQGAADAWLYSEIDGAIADKGAEEAACTAMDLIRNRGALWRLDQPNTWVRQFVENPLFGKWNYPLGVTLYGLLQTGKLLGRSDWVEYVNKHIESCTSLYQYAMEDKARFGASGVLNTLSTLDSLDDCGSFGATMLLALQERELVGAAEIGDLIADYISSKQDRLPDGALYRKPRYVDVQHPTLWCDDLYMSVPFLCRYYLRTGELRYVQDAANLFVQYKKRLFIPEQGIMSHVYDFKVEKATKVPWGRGNGWVLFSLSELLAVMPVHMEEREELLLFFNELCKGYLSLQGENGLWHQVLTDPESYEETSCTSMFLYAFARGIRNSWIEDSGKYLSAVQLGWRGISLHAVDKFGNVYGVCRGSGYSFDEGYYKNDLSWLLNDTHGIGIVLLAGIEVLQLNNWLERK